MKTTVPMVIGALGERKGMEEVHPKDNNEYLFKA